MKDPIALFQAWLQEAIEAGLKEPTAMTVATVDVDGHPDARMLLLKGCDERGFVFFTNLESRKAAKNFDHSKTPYSLTGLHIKVACEKCHKPDAPGGPVRYQSMKCDTCSACHSDPHRGCVQKSLRQLPYHQRVENDAGGL